MTDALALEERIAHLIRAVEDLSDVVARQEMYRRLTHISESIVHVAERIWYVSVKEA